MPLMEVLTIPDPVLRQKARKVTDFGESLQTLIDDMIETMRAAPGVGLAGPQVAKLLRVIVVEFGDEEDETVLPKLYTVVNPEIVKTSNDEVLGVEGCLSIPGIVGEVPRATNATIKGFSRRGQPLRVKTKGWLARIFQHEIDHLNGVLYIDHAEKIWKLEEEENPDTPPV